MMASSGLCATHDTGPPLNRSNYTTLVILHGYVWHSGIFSNLIPIAEDHNTRLVLVNRRDYPGSTPYTVEELNLLPVIGPDANEKEVADAKDKLLLYMKARARELYDFLAALVRDHDIPVAQPEQHASGIVVAGWSLATIWMEALLAFVSSFPVEDIDLSKYVRRVVLYDPVYHVIGYPHPEHADSPLFDGSLEREDGMQVFNNWISGYFAHGDTPSTLERRNPLRVPKPTIAILSAADLAACTHPTPGEPGGSDYILLQDSNRTTLCRELLTRTLYPPVKGARELEVAWPDTELRLVWCQQSVWGVPYGVWALQAEIEDAKKKGVPVRDVRIVRIRNGNHFIHWDQPDWALRALVGDEDEIV